MRAAIHSVCRNNLYPRSQIKRFTVPDDKVPWNVSFPEYNPAEYTSPGIIGKPFADPIIGSEAFKPKWNSIDGLVNRKSYEGEYAIAEDGFPLNPKGRTGIKGRGLLGKWGPNHAADPIVSRWKLEVNGDIIKHPKSAKPILQVVVIKRADSGMWAFPGGMVDPGELVSTTAVREFLEEATNFMSVDDDEKGKLQMAFQSLFSKGEHLTESYVDDPRNTDNAWMETVVYNYHDEEGTNTKKMPLHVGDETIGVRWLDVDSSLILYASHKDFLEKLVSIRMCHW